MKISNQKIAIIGISCSFPKANNYLQLWDNLVNSRDCITHFNNQVRGTITDVKTINARGILDNVKYFDAAYFGISEQEAAIMDPQHRLFISHCQKSLENAGYNPKSMKKNVGVFASSSDSTYLHKNLLLNSEYRKNHFNYRTNILTGSGFLATRVSYLLNFTGPSININVACSSSLVSVIYACKALTNNETDLCLAGGASVKCPQLEKAIYRTGSIYAPDGICRPYDVNASGTVSSNGVAVITLKRLSNAIRDKDNIIAIISGYAVNNDGSAKIGYTAPSVERQSECIQSAISQANINPTQISYIEGHGTATQLGDAVEIQAIKNAFVRMTNKMSSCALGSIKSNIGHTDMASGIAGLIKAALMLKNKILVPTIHHDLTNPAFNLAESPFYINTNTKAWNLNENQEKRIASVNSLGIGGTNAHLILEEYSGNQTQKKSPIPTALKNEKKYWIEPNLQEQPSADISINKIYDLNTPCWELIHVGPPLRRNTETWVIFANEDSLSQMITRTLSDLGQKFIIFTRDKIHSDYFEGGYHFKLSSQPEYQQANIFIKNNFQEINHVVYLWSYSSEEISYLTNLKMIFSCVLRQHLDDIMSVKLFTTNSININHTDSVNPLNAMIHGFGLVLSQEFNLRCITYDLGFNIPINKVDLTNMLVFYEANESYQMLAYRNNILLKRAIKPWHVSCNFISKIEKKCNIVITGGLGNIGLATAELFAKQYHANILLISRKKSCHSMREGLYLVSQCEAILDNGIVEVLNRIDKYSSSLRISFGDVTSYENMRLYIEKFINNVGAIDYVFHLAAKIDKKSKHPIRDITSSEVLKQLSPKLYGLINIKKITKSFKVKNVIVFSSIATYLGGISMATYTSINMAIDAYISSIKTDAVNWLCLNWDAWPRDMSPSDKERALNSLDFILNHISRSKEQIYVASDDINLRAKHLVSAKGVLKEDVDVKTIISRIFSNCLGVEKLSVDDDFFELGGDSLSAIELIEQVEKNLSISLSHEFLYKNRSINSICSSLSQKTIIDNKEIFKINKSNGAPIFLFHPLSGMNTCYIHLATCLEDKHSCYCIQDPEIKEGNVIFSNFKDMVDYYYNLVKLVQSQGNYILIGYSFGGSIAHAIAKRLEAEGHENLQLYIIDSWAAFSSELKNKDHFNAAVKEHTNEILNRVSNKHMEERIVRLLWHRMQLLFEYKHEVIESNIFLIKAGIVLNEYKEIDHPCNHWDRHTKKNIYVYNLPYDHASILNTQSSHEISCLINKKIPFKIYR